MTLFPTSHENRSDVFSTSHSLNYRLPFIFFDTSLIYFMLQIKALFYLKRCFDKVTPLLLLETLFPLEFPDTITSWISSYLSNHVLDFFAELTELTACFTLQFNSFPFLMFISLSRKPHVFLISV